MNASLTHNDSSYLHQDKDIDFSVHSADLRPIKPLPLRPPLQLVEQEGQLQIHTAPYRGSFSIVLSAALRAAGLGSRVMVIQFLKGGVNQGPDGIVQLCGNLQWLRPDIDACLADHAQEVPADNKMKTQKKAVQAIWTICRDHLLKGDLEQLVLDEIGLAIVLGYLNEADVIATLKNRKHAMDLILTGPSIPPGIMAMADQVTELRCGF